MADEEHTTIITEPSDRGGGGWFIGLVLLLGIILAVIFFTGSMGTERAKDTAITDAAQDVGAAAEKVGNAAEKAVDKVDGK
ncbi:MAG: hypothetical protein AB1408_01195 [Pseudomonadota bacterium]|mgnify:FL=1|jgi:hypothetical protein